jgi:hypothetical protein
LILPWEGNSVKCSLSKLRVLRVVGFREFLTNIPPLDKMGDVHIVRQGAANLPSDCFSTETVEFF